MVDEPRCRLKPAQVRLFLDGQRIQQVRTYKYLGLTIDDRVTWRPAVTETIALSRRLLSTFRQVYGSPWGLTETSMLTLFKGRVVSRVLYLLPLFFRTSVQWDQLETVQGVTFRVYLGILRCVRNAPTLVQV